MKLSNVDTTDLCDVLASLGYHGCLEWNQGAIFFGDN